VAARIDSSARRIFDWPRLYRCDAADAGEASIVRGGLPLSENHRKMIQDVCSSLLDLLLPFPGSVQITLWVGTKVWPRRLRTKEITYVKDSRFVRLGFR
jgi:hypothetical protein